MEYNRLLAYRQTKRNWDLHEEKVKTIKPTLNTRETSYQFKPKLIPKKYGQLNRLLDVQYQNKALLKKLTQCKSRSNLAGKPQKVKLSKGKHVMEDQQRQMQNRGLLKRIQNSKASYRTDSYLKQHKENQKYANIFCKYNYKGQKPNKTIVKFEMTNDVEKYVDSRRNMNALTEKNDGEKPKVLNKIIQIHDQIPLRISNEEFSVRAVERQMNLILQIIRQSTSYTLELEREVFMQKYQGKIQKVIKKLRFSKSTQQFYLN